MVIGQNVSIELALIHVAAERRMKTMSAHSLACCPDALPFGMLMVTGVSYETCKSSGHG